MQSDVRPALTKTKPMKLRHDLQLETGDFLVAISRCGSIGQVMATLTLSTTQYMHNGGREALSEFRGEAKRRK